MSSVRTYIINDVVTFKKTTEAYGGLSNMAKGYPLRINGTVIPSAEHLYQACRFPYNPEIQYQIINEPNPMKAKWISRKYTSNTRKDWEAVKFKIMQWVIEVKLSQNWSTFGSVLKSTEGKAIVEVSHKDKVWAAIKYGDTLVGINALGRLIMLVREKYIKGHEYYRCIESPEVSDFLLYGNEIDTMCNDDFYIEIEDAMSRQSIIQ